MKLIVDGMSGIGDCIHERAILPALMQNNEVWLRTSFPQLFHDVPGIHLTPLYGLDKDRVGRTQIKNERRSAQYYEGEPRRAKRRNIRYSGADVRETGSIVEAMAKAVGVRPVKAFSLGLKLAWLADAERLISSFKTSKPIMIYRPVTLRKDFARKGGARNPDLHAYAELLASVRHSCFLVSVADLEPSEEWIVGEQPAADATFHQAELSIEVLAALIAKSQIVFSPAGFAPIVAQAVGTPSIAIFGGHESSKTISFGKRLTPTLAIDPIHPCDCFDPDHGCDKTIDMPAALRQLDSFVRQYV